jgi:YHS domain-containing protein
MKKAFVAMCSVALLAMVAIAAEEVKLDGINCVVAGNKPAKADKSVDYKGGKVYFCCDNCPKAFEKDPAKFAVSANKQLVATKQATQVACPYTGKKVADGTGVKVGGVEVGFCCMNCKGATEKDLDGSVAKVFGDEGFKKGFKVNEKK